MRFSRREKISSVCHILGPKLLVFRARAYAHTQTLASEREHVSSSSVHSKWHDSTLKGSNALHLVCQQSSQGCLETTPKMIWLNRNRFRPQRVELRAASFLHWRTSFRRSMLWLVRVQKVLKLLSTCSCQAVDQLCCLLFSPIYLPVHSLWHGQGSRSTVVFAV